MDTSGETSRFEKSLGLLTTRFVNLLQAADYGILDLKLVKTKTSLFDTINADFYLFIYRSKVVAVFVIIYS